MQNAPKTLLAYDLTSADMSHAVLSAMAQVGLSPTPAQAATITDGIMTHLDALRNTRARSNGRE